MSKKRPASKTTRTKKPVRSASSKPPKKPSSKPVAEDPPIEKRRGNYEAYRDRQADVSRRRSAAGREIGPCGSAEDPKRRERCAKSLKLFAETYASDQLKLSWSEDHLKAITRMEECILEGGLFALAMPRGSGKTTLSEIAAVWAIVYGYRKFVMIVAATGEKANEILDRIKGLIESSDLLAADFPEVVKPILALEGINNRASGQTVEGYPTCIAWGKKQIILPTVRGSKASGAIIRVAGITGAIRGAKHLTAKGESRRPDLALVDDASTEKSARSLHQNLRREQVIKRAVLRLAGPGEKIAVFMLCTVIEASDLADRFLDRKKNPEWRGERCQMLYSFPKDEKLWEEYRRLRQQGFEDGDNGAAATAFYKSNRKAMDEGAVAGWPARYEDGEISAIQSAMNLYLSDPACFYAEYQNTPQTELFGDGIKRLDTALLVKRISGVERYQVPHECTKITCFIDVSGYVLWYASIAWTPRFAGSIVDYGCWPPQSRSHFKQTDARPSLKDVFPGMDEGERIFAGLGKLCAELLSRQFQLENSQAVLRIERLLIDSGYKNEVIHQFVRQLDAGGTIVMPSMGRGRTESQRGLGEWKKHKDELSGYAWRRTIAQSGRGFVIQYEPDAWKSFIFERLTAPQGSRATLNLFGKPGTNISHQLIADHLSAEYGTLSTIRGHTMDRWKLVPPADRDNHLFDCCVGAAVGAAVGGLVWTANDRLREAMQNKPRVVTQEEINRAQRQRKVIRPGESE
jgi:hypothetical protein